MPAAKMHDGQVETTVDLLRRLLSAQFPHLAQLPVQPVEESGTDHALYRLGADLVARLPIIAWAVEQAERDQRWLPVLAPHLPLSIPVPVAVGRPGEGYPWPWSVGPWIAGETPNGSNLDASSAAVALAEFVQALHAVPTTSGPVNTGTTRGVPLSNLDAGIRLLIAQLRDEIDTTAVTRVWDEAVAAPRWGASLVWIHGDVQPGNLIVREARVSFRNAIGADDATWARGKGWVLARRCRGCATTGTAAPSSPPLLGTASMRCSPTGPEGSATGWATTSRSTRCWCPSAPCETVQP